MASTDVFTLQQPTASFRQSDNNRSSIEIN